MECRGVTSPVNVHNPAIDYFDPDGFEELQRSLTHTDHPVTRPPIVRARTEPPNSRNRVANKPLSVKGDGDARLTEATPSEQESEDTTVAALPDADGDGEQFDFEQRVRAYINKRDEAGIEPRTLGVLFDGLEVVGLGQTAAARQQPTLSSLFNPVDIFHAIQAKRHPPLRKILSGFEGVVRPGEMLLVLGQPGAGCTTFLKALTNQTESYRAVTGDIAFSSLTPELLRDRFRGDVQYIPEDDLHFPTLSVEETVRFAARCRAPARPARVSKNPGDVDGKDDLDSRSTRKEYEKHLTDLFLTLFGLRHVRGSVVGDEKLRGVSGGEKKRVSIAEAMAARALIGGWDNSTRGLDSSTALSFLTALRIATSHLQRTTMVCLYQASNGMYELFDKVCLIYEGRMIYFGPGNEAKKYFEDMGWQARNRQSVPDFLVSVTDEQARVLRDNSVPETEGQMSAPETPGYGSDDAAMSPVVNPNASPAILPSPSSPQIIETRRSQSSQVPQAARMHPDMTFRGAIRDIRAPVPRTPAEFAAYYQASDICRRNREDMDAFRKECGLIPKNREAELGELEGSGEKVGQGPENTGALVGGLAAPTSAAPGVQVAPLLAAPDPFAMNASTWIGTRFGRTFSRRPSHTATTDAAVGHPPGKAHPQTQAFKQSVLDEHAKCARRGSPYVISTWMQLRAVMRRRGKIVQGDMLTQVLTTGTFVVQSVIIGTVFVNIDDATAAYFSRGGIMFFALFLPALFSMSEIPALFSQRPIIRRHERAAMYHPMIEALAMTLVDIPSSFVTIVIYCIVLYFVIGLQRTASQFFIFFLFVFTGALTMKSFFRALAAIFPSQAPAQAVAGVLVLAVSIYTGYQIPIPDMIGALRWISYINPLRYAFEGVLVNEFHTLDGQCSSLVPSGPGYDGISLDNQVCTTVGSVAGRSTVDGNAFVAQSFGYSYSHLWRNFGILVAFGIGFTFLLLLFTEIQTTNSRAGNDIVLFKRGSEAASRQADDANGEDEEKDPKLVASNSTAINPSNGDSEAHRRLEEQKAIVANQPKMTDVFSWSKIRYTIPVGHNEHRVLLDDVSGFVAPGKLTALMGASGAGKTTLLNVLASRVDTGVVTGERFVNGQTLPSDFQAQTGYCQQMDTHEPTMTVRESLVFSARLRQPASVPTAEKDAYAEKCLKMCGLEEYADAMVGTLGVEHKKRTTIGVELAAKPRLLLFLDEPTSGLDSQSAWAIVSFLRDLADNGQAILCTIHQPSAELFQVFDRLLLLQRGGQTVYFGDLGHHATTLLDYFEGNGARKCQPGENPAEYMLDVIGAGATAVADRDWHDLWIKTGGSQRLSEDLDGIHAQGRKDAPVKAELHSQFATSWGYQLKEVTIRQYASYWRFTFFKAGDSIQDTQNKVFAIFMATILSSPLAGQMLVPLIASRDIFEVRESASRTYSWSVLATSQLLVEIPWNILGSTLFFLCWYWTVGFDSDRGGYSYLMFGVLFPCYFTTIALAIASMAPTAAIAGLLFNFLFSFVLTFNGVVQPFSQLGWWQWMYHVSPYTYLIEGLLGQAIGRQQIVCADKELVAVNPPSGSNCSSFFENYISNRGGYLNNPDATSGCQFCPSRTTDEFLGPTFNIFYRHRWRDLGIFCGFIVINTVAVYIFAYAFRVKSVSRSIMSMVARVRKPSRG
ncbi:hypothetical protein ONZ45_g3902 [Pleurotus djamor]|nr:hypothetical protein ONZ45_g3902 [Pleurotus djamor]